MSTPAKRTQISSDEDFELQTPESYAPRPSSSRSRSTKRVETSINPEDLSYALGLTQEELAQLGASDDLISHFQTIQSAYSSLYVQLEQLKQEKQQVVAVPVPEAELWSEEKVDAKAKQIRQLAVQSIKKQMKWQPSCKKGSTKWNYEGMVPNLQVLNKVFNLPEAKKAWKQKKIPRTAFGELFGHISASIRYGWLSLTGENITLAWNAEDSTFTLRGTYGL